MLNGSRKMWNRSFASQSSVPMSSSSKQTIQVTANVLRPALLRDVVNVLSHVNMTKIQSQPANVLSASDGVTWTIDFEPKSEKSMQEIIESLEPFGKASQVDPINVPWFPRKIYDLDALDQDTAQYGAELDADHPGFNDKTYTKRRHEIAEIAYRYKLSDLAVPEVEYSDVENETWSTVWDYLKPLHRKYACDEFLAEFEKLERAGLMTRHRVPHLQALNDYMVEQTGFRFKPTAGLLTARDFLNALAFRVFNSTQYIRHHSKPRYTPEPDIVHEIMGHAPMFANHEFAAFSQYIGLASIGASDDELIKLANCYWHTVEFGLIKDGQHTEKRKIYGAGILSSAGEILYSMGQTEQKPQYLDFSFSLAENHRGPITSLQPLYYVMPSFEEAKKQMEKYGRQMKRPFDVSYNRNTGEIEIDRSVTIKSINFN